MSADELAAWLRLQVDEDERLALACDERKWSLDGGSIVGTHPTDPIVDWAYDENGPHIERQDPARTLAEVEVKRLIISMHRSTAMPDVPGRPRPRQCLEDGDLAPCLTLRLLALPYATCDGYREEWKP